MDKLDERIRRAIDEKVFPGCVIGLLRDGERNVRTYGESYPVYDVASITKSIPLASLAALFIDAGKIALSDVVVRFVPELQHDYEATIEDLLRYRVHGTQMSTLRFETFEEIRSHALERGFAAAPGESHYSNLPAFVLGIGIERVGGASIETLAHGHVFEPLGMTETTFFPAKDLCAPTEVVDGEVIQGIPHDESARVFARARRSVGHAGLFSTADDLLTFAWHLIRDSDGPVARAAEAGLGWQIHDPSFMGTEVSGRTFGKTGFTGTSILVDPEGRAALVILSNRTYPTRPAEASAVNALRRDVADILFHTG